MKNLTVRPEPIPQRRGYPERGHQHTPPPPPERPFAINIVQQPEQNQMQLKDVVRFAGESFSAMKAMQDEYGRSIPATYAERDTVDDLKEEVRTLSDKERDFSLTGDASGNVEFDGSKDVFLNLSVNNANFATRASTANSAESCSSANSAINAISATTADTCTGNASTATKLATGRKFTFTGDISAKTTFDGSKDLIIPVTVADTFAKKNDLPAFTFSVETQDGAPCLFVTDGTKTYKFVGAEV